MYRAARLPAPFRTAARAPLALVSALPPAGPTPLTGAASGPPLHGATLLDVTSHPRRPRSSPQCRNASKRCLTPPCLPPHSAAEFARKNRMVCPATLNVLSASTLERRQE